MAINRNWYLKYKNNPDATIRLFCFHHSGGGASLYRPWIDYLSPNIELIAIQLPGREDRFTEPFCNNLKDITTILSEEFAIYKDKPFFVFGHSLGALISFELIKSIQKLYSLNPYHVIISATKAPHLPFRMKYLSQLDDHALKEELRIYDGIDELILNNKELLELFLPIIKSDFSIYENYNCLESIPIPCDILALSGDHDQTVTEEEILAWSRYTTGKFEHISFPGKHFYIKDHQKTILEIINRIGDRGTHNQNAET